MSATEEMLTNMLLVLARVEKKVDQLIQQTAPPTPADDEPIGRDPSEKYWTGASCKGLRMSECPPDYLRAYSKYRYACVFMARKENNPEKMKYVDRDEKSAKLAKEWAEYREALGYGNAPSTSSEPPSQTVSETLGEGSDIPF